jgi:hypothetical protein
LPAEAFAEAKGMSEKRMKNRELVWAGHGNDDRNGGISAGRIIFEMGLKGSYTVEGEISVLSRSASHMLE